VTRPNPTELAALQLAAHGHTTKTIARHLNTSPQAVGMRIRRAAQKLGAANRAHAVALAIGAGWITPPTPTRTTD
jgi:LuxR family transcriptional regulator, activator of conjugal transfer of Ti plasmids